MGVFLAGAIIAGAAAGVKACSSPKSLGSDISIVTHNDLYGVNSTRCDAVITLSGSMTKWDASSACSSLNEGLWNPQQDDFLQYLVYQNQPGPYWTAGGCTLLTSDGPQTTQCADDTKLPVLCSQSAPLSTSTKQDNSTQWWIETQTQGVNVIGFRDRSAFRFEGIRYASQPERFTYSSLYKPTADYNALSFQSQCVQAGNVGSEDCLWLNVWTPFLPRNPDDEDCKLKPVMFWIHGGAFTGGTGADPTVDGDALASRGDVVVVTINYRLTTLGFLALDDGSTNGNYGLGDMVTALEWVQANIKSFGGDPNKVTIFGQSAGAGAVRALLGSPPAFGKYAAAIPQSNLAGSNYASTYSTYYNISTVDSMYSQKILNATGCLNATSHVDCLRGVSPYLLANLTTVARFLVIDNNYILTPQIEVSGHGQVANVPLMMGHMRDDAAAFIGYPKSNLSVSQFLPSQGFQLSNATLALFPVPDGTNSTLDVFNASALVATDSEFRCLDQATVYSAVNHAVIDDIYFYEFNRSYQTPGYNPNRPVCQPPIEPGYPYGNPNKEYFKCHSGELYYAFGTLTYNGLPLRDEHDIPFSQITVDRWASFARTHDPNPQLAFLKARGFSNSTWEIENSDPWQKLSAGGDSGKTLRVLQWPSFQAGFQEFGTQQQCDALEFPWTFYENL